MDGAFFILLIFNICFYFMCCVMLMRRQNLTCISIRSPKLLILNNLGGFFMSSLIIGLKVLPEDRRRYFSGLYYIFHFLMMVSFCLRTQRILNCCQINTDEHFDLQQFYNKRHIFEEKYYIKLTFIILGILIVLLAVLDAFGSSTLFDHYFTVNFIDVDNQKDINEKEIFIQFILFLVINWAEQMVLLTYFYKICINEIKQKLRFELGMFLLIWILYSNAATLIDYLKISSYNFIIMGLSLGVCYLSLFLNAILPIMLSYSYKISIGYHFTPRLLNNLYLFLANESCFKEFNDYLNESNYNNGKIYLKIYTQIMNYKLGFVVGVGREQGYQEANDIYNTYFNNNGYREYLNQDIIDKVNDTCQSLDNNIYTSEMFDEALAFVFNELGKLFGEFRKTSRFRELYEDMYYTSYIQCKMTNVGLINKF